MNQPTQATTPPLDSPTVPTGNGKSNRRSHGKIAQLPYRAQKVAVASGKNVAYARHYSSLNVKNFTNFSCAGLARRIIILGKAKESFVELTAETKKTVDERRLIGTIPPFSLLGAGQL